MKNKVILLIFIFVITLALTGCSAIEKITSGGGEQIESEEDITWNKSDESKKTPSVSNVDVRYRVNDNLVITKYHSKDKGTRLYDISSTGHKSFIGNIDGFWKTEGHMRYQHAKITEKSLKEINDLLLSDRVKGIDVYQLIQEYQDRINLYFNLKYKNDYKNVLNDATMIENGDTDVSGTAQGEWINEYQEFISGTTGPETADKISKLKLNISADNVRLNCIGVFDPSDETGEYRSGFVCIVEFLVDITTNKLSGDVATLPDVGETKTYKVTFVTYPGDCFNGVKTTSVMWPQGLYIEECK